MSPDGWIEQIGEDGGKTYKFADPATRGSEQILLEYGNHESFNVFT